MSGNSTSIDELLKRGVSKEVIQEMLHSDPSLLAQITPGPTQKRVISRAKQVTGKCLGNCCTGCQQIYAGLTGEITLDKYSQAWNGLERIDGYNGGNNFGKALTNTGNFLSITYNKTEYDTLIQYAPSGTNFSWANTEKRGASASGGDKWGHTAVWLADSKTFRSDGVQTNVNGDRYGPTIDITISNDCQVSPELAARLIQRQDEINKQHPNIRKQIREQLTCPQDNTRVAQPPHPIIDRKSVHAGMQATQRVAGAKVTQVRSSQTPQKPQPKNKETPAPKPQKAPEKTPIEKALDWFKEKVR